MRDNEILSVADQEVTPSANLQKDDGHQKGADQQKDAGRLRDDVHQTDPDIHQADQQKGEDRQNDKDQENDADRQKDDVHRNEHEMIHVVAHRQDLKKPFPQINML